MSYEEEDFGKRYLWDLLPDDTVRLLRVYTQGGEFRVPEQIEGKTVAVIGAYCFADAEHIQGYELRESLSGESLLYDRSMSALAGAALERLCLPDSVNIIEDLAFYNCRALKSLEMGAGIQQLGSDVFMNCSALEEIILRCGVEEVSCANLVLSRISTEILVHFLGGDAAAEAKLLYPEYLESYDEIAPAHIFGRNITGEGFRARQLFTDGVVQIARYDEIFDKATAEESPLTSAKMALMRLLYPVELKEEKREQYQKHIQKNALTIAKYYIELRDLMTLQKMCEYFWLSGTALEEAIRCCISAEWSEGSAALLNWKQKYDRTNRENRYSFEDW